MRKGSERAREQERHAGEDSALIDDIRSGDRARYDAAWAELYRRYFDRIAAGMSGRVPDRATAEEITQHAFVKAAEHIDSFLRDSSFYAWIYRIAQNNVVDASRQRLRRKTDSHEVFDTFADDKLSADRVIEQRETGAEVQQAFATLLPDHAEILRLRELEHLSYKEIADRLKISEEAASVRTYRARQQLKKRLSQHSEDGAPHDAEVPTGQSRRGSVSTSEKATYVSVTSDDEHIARLRAELESELAPGDSAKAAV